MWKSILTLLILSIFVWLSWYSFVSGGYLVFNPEVRFVASAWDTIYLEEDIDAKTVLVYRANFDISTARINSLCNIESRYLDSSKNLYFFEVDYSSDLDCNNWNVVLQLWEEIYANTIHKLDIMKGNIIFGKYLDYSDTELEWIQDELQYQLTSNAIFKNYNNSNIAKNFRYYKGKKEYNNAQLHNNLIDLILDGRKQKYLTPVLGRTFSTRATKLPNSARPYRSAYTDGIHYGFDIDGELRDTVIALDTWLVVRVVDGFDNQSDFSRIVYWDNLSRNQQLKNLDILRGNQVWIKTLKWEVVFYSHLDSINEEITEGSLVTKWQKIGLTWVSWVPEDGYDDFHLHFEIYKNPYNILKAGSYDFWEYMQWEYLWKGMNNLELIELIENTFE